jgi:hypothetical protein
MTDERIGGVLSNHANTIDATKYSGTDSQVVSDFNYSDNSVVRCFVPSGIMFDKTFSKRDLEGFYAVRVFYNSTKELDPFEVLLIMEIYEDGELITWTTGDQNNGQIQLYYSGETATLGMRVVLWFDPTKSYRIILRTTDDLDGTYGIDLDYLQFTQIHHANPLVNWINASETTGGDLIIIDMNTDSIQGTGAVYASTSILLQYEFKKIYYANAVAESTSGIYNINVSNVTANTFNVTARTTNDSSILSTTVIPIRWFAIGTIELPLLRPL